ncbi:putative bifunctional diguanylate cyclase/phosphodiesterase [Thiocystis violacea]|uniref:putative bifunctional diguanylate cyclase/phosphodiesterase n=1 Tax=Thiocystis violacea TaxID=13725 RepID=UPI0019069C75|nr:EAL domain-containing protein [Thiocystis violacea]MBK1718606.1 hypothetical protein [Thiocystis violacea]
MLRTIRGRLALRFTLLLAGLMVVMLSLTGWLGYRMLDELRPRIQGAFEETQTLNEKNVLLNSAGYLSAHLFPRLVEADIQGLNQEIDRVKSWLPIRSFIIAGLDKRILTDGTVANARRGRILPIPTDLLPQQPLLDARPEFSRLSFMIGEGQRIAGYAVLELSNVALRTSLRVLDQEVTSQWERASRSLLLGAGFTFLLLGLIAAILIQRLSRSFSQPISEMVAAAESCASGNLDVVLNVRSNDELGHLALALNTMAKELKVTHRRMRHLANYDSLTGLPNRHLFQDRLRHALHAAERGGRQIGLLFLDLDGFKAINDTLGHGLGDEILKLVGARLRETVRASDTVARLGGDEFTVLAEGVQDDRDVEALAAKLLSVLERPYRIHEHQLHLSASIGLTLYPRDGTAPDDLLRNADTAMYQAKHDGKNAYRCFTPELDRHANDRISLERTLLAAIDQQAFELHYQPQIEARSGRLVGVEALLRWRDRDEVIQPDEFIPLLEDSGLITRLTVWILTDACRALAHWRASDLPDLRLAINLSIRQLAQPDLSALIERILQENGLEADALDIEITERTLLNAHDGHAALERLRRLGVRLVIDNFGTGYSSLAYLHRLSVRGLKIDRGFIQGAATNPNDALITATLIALAKQLGIETIGQGVETLPQWRHLLEQGCDRLQGYFIAPPLPPAPFIDWARASGGAASGLPDQAMTHPEWNLNPH